MNVSSSPPARNSSGNGPGTETVEVKRRACDECRSRKLACSKESDGCARCKREGIDCHYSAQKPMGRPRKRPNANYSPQVSVASKAVRDVQEEYKTVPDADTDVAMMGHDVLHLDPASFLEASLTSNADISIADMSFLEFLGSEFMLNQPLGIGNFSPAMPIGPMDWTTHLHDVKVGTQLGDPDESATLTAPSLSSRSESTPDQQHPSQLTPSSSLAPPEPLQSTSCSCLADLYLALDSVTRLPTEVIPALRTARTAARTAHNTIRCEVCCPPIHKSMKITASAFQNSMLLGALIPTIADAYHRILELVDAETARAIATHTQLTFKLPEYGGIWGPLSSCNMAGGGADGRDANEVHETKVMDPAIWRRSVRSLLKTDVYGVNSVDGGGGGGGGGTTARFHQVGLRDLVAEMDEKSRSRHAEVDAMIDAGLPAPIGMSGLPAYHSHSKQPHCRHTIQLARDAVENLHIT